MRCAPRLNLDELTQIVGRRTCYGSKPAVRVGYYKKICLSGDPTEIQGLRGDPYPRVFVEIVECKKLNASRVVSGVSRDGWKVRRTPASFPSALIEDRWGLIGATGWSVLTLMVASG